MIVYKCDGSRYSDNFQCSSTFESKFEGDKPYKWIYFNGSIVNEKDESRLKQGNGTFHFCSRACLDFFLWKNEDFKATRTVLKESLSALEWMFENMSVNNPELQSDSFNIPANAIEQLKKHIEKL